MKQKNRKRYYQAQILRSALKVLAMNNPSPSDIKILEESPKIRPLRELIAEAYIDPIRSVLIVDDEYPTLDAYMRGQRDFKEENVERLRNLIKECRSPQSNWLVDVHDGAEFSSDGATDNLAHLHQSDLLILDYHLDGSDLNTRSINIIKKVASSEHSNIIVVYTNGYGGPGSELAKVGLEIAKSLTRVPVELSTLSRTVPKLLQVWEDENDDFDPVKAMLDSFDHSTLTRVINGEAFDWPSLKNLPGLEALSEILTQRSKATKNSHADLGPWAVSKKALLAASDFSDKDQGKVDYSLEKEIWIKTEKLFITVIGKNTSPKDLKQKLLDSLEHWGPSPHRLLMAKIRSELENTGVRAESTVLGKKFVQAGWLEKVLNSNSPERPWLVQETAARHWEEIAATTQASITKYALEVFASLPDQENSSDFIKKHTGVELAGNKSNVALHLNYHVCSRPIIGHHLMPGHILCFESTQDEPEYWLCLSPICDLVPGQSQRWGSNKAKNFMPFKAVLLHKTTVELALKDANSNNIIFPKISNEIIPFKFVQKTGDNPHWEQMFAHNDGYISEGVPQTKITRIRINGEGLGSFETSATIVAQLRYEYALNLLQRLGNSLSRVGLDFVKI
jgi:CheY-like chemotaxis protein